MMSANTIHDSPFDQLVASPTHPVDMLPPHPGLAKEELRRQLVALRKAAGLTHRDIREESGWSLSKISDIETGSGHIIPADARAMLSIYDIKDEALISELTKKAHLVKAAHKSGSDDLFSTAEMSFLKHEAEASALRMYASDLLPDVMQPLEYAHALARVLKPGIDPERARDLDDFRQDRAAYLLGQYGPEIHVILDENVLRRAIGGEQLSNSDSTKFSVMALAINGLRSLLSTGAKNSQLNPRITIQVAPYDFGPYPLMKYPYSILDMPDNDDKPLVYVNGNLHGQSNDRAPKVQTASYVEAFDELAQRIPEADQTDAILRWILDSYAS